MAKDGESKQSGPWITSTCELCQHLVAWPYCFAFLTGKGIPEEIKTGRIQHNSPYPGDHGITFSPRGSPYQLSEDGMKALLLAYRGQVIMPALKRDSFDDDEEIGYGIPADEALEISIDLMEASARGDLASIKEFLRLGGDINIRDSYGNTALMHACRHCQPEVVRLLLDVGADVTARDRYNKTALDIALDWGYPSIVEMLQTHSLKQPA